MDAYTKTWLQFVFPAYIWVLVGLMIFISHFSQKFANLLCSNPVSLLATLILLSYTKVLRTLIATVYIQYTTEKCGCIMEILTINGKHIPLFLVAVLVFLFLFLTLSCFSLVSGCRPYHTWGSSHGSTVPGWNYSRMHTMHPTKQNIVTGLDYCLCFALFFYYSVCLQLSAKPQCKHTSNSGGNWDTYNMGLDQWWSL